MLCSWFVVQRIARSSRGRVPVPLANAFPWGLTRFPLILGQMSVTTCGAQPKSFSIGCTKPWGSPAARCSPNKACSGQIYASSSRKKITKSG